MDDMAHRMAAAERAQALLDSVVTIQSNPHYRLADVFYGRGYRYEDSAAQVLARDEFRGTLLRQFLEANGTSQRKNYALLNALVDEYARSTPSVQARHNEVAIHVRAGDVVEHAWFLETDFKRLIQRSHCKNCTIVIAFAFQEFAEMNWWMFSNEKLEQNRVSVRALFEDIIESLPEVDLRVCSSSDIDQDFVRLVLAQRFVRDRGGFSDLVQELRSQRGLAMPCENPLKVDANPVGLKQFRREEADASLGEIIRGKDQLLRRQSQELKRLRQELDRLRRREEADASLGEIIREKDQFIQQERQETKRLRQELDQLRSSTSWRITKPLRYLKRTIR